MLFFLFRILKGMLESIKGLRGWCLRIAKWSTNFDDEELWNKMNWMGTQSLQWQLALEANWQIIEK
jgi:hypothetical protein